MIPKGNVEELQSAVDGDVRAAYVAVMKSGYMDAVIELTEATGVLPQLKEEDAHSVYKHLVRRGDVSAIRKVDDITNVQPQFTKEDVQTGYEYIFEQCFNSNNSNKLLDTLTTGLSGWLYGSKKLKDLSGIGPHINADMKGKIEGAAQIIYEEYLEREEFSRIGVFRKISGIAPAKELLKRYNITEEALE